MNRTLITATMNSGTSFHFCELQFLHLQNVTIRGFAGGQWKRIRLPVQETCVHSPGWEDPLEKGMATHPRIPAWRIPWTEEPGGLQSMGLQKSWIQLTD